MPFTRGLVRGPALALSGRPYVLSVLLGLAGEYWHVSDIHATVKQLLGAGAQEQQAVHDVGWLIGSVTDADGNVIGLVQPA